jgi:N-acetylglucosaminyldiphosphoundecaprenol N-acetyl-beta-D-mannosaminyltransferase
MTDSQVDLSFVPRVNVLGVGVHAINMSTAVRIIETAIDDYGKGYVCVTGVHGIMEAQKDPSLVQLFSNAMLVLPDGMPTVWIGHLQGFGGMDRVFGPELMLTIAGRSELTKCSHFLYGGGPGVAERLRDVLLHRFPSIRILGTFTPPFRPLTSDEETELFSTVNRLRPDIIWVGMSTPKQERFMAEYLNLLNTTVVVGVGAAFDFLGGTIKDSPQWIKRSGLQWAHRLLQEPRRLWKRYLVNNPQFIFQIGLQIAGLRRYELQAQTRHNRHAEARLPAE